ESALAKLPNHKLSGADVVAAVKHLAHSGFLIASNKAKAGSPRPTFDVIVVRGANRKAIQPVVGRVMLDLMGDAKVQSVTKAGRSVKVVARAKAGNWAWWVEKEDLVIAPAGVEDVDSIVEVVDGKKPNAASHPLRAELAKPEAGFEPVV